MMNRSMNLNSPGELVIEECEKQTHHLSTLLQCSFASATLETGVLHLHLKLRAEDNQPDVFHDFAEGNLTCTKVTSESCSDLALDCDRCGKIYKKKESTIQVILKGAVERCACDKSCDKIQVHFRTEGDSQSYVNQSEETFLKQKNRVVSDQHDVIDNDDVIEGDVIVSDDVIEAGDVIVSDDVIEGDVIVSDDVTEADVIESDDVIEADDVIESDNVTEADLKKDDKACSENKSVKHVEKSSDTKCSADLVNNVQTSADIKINELVKSGSALARPRRSCRTKAKFEGTRNEQMSDEDFQKNVGHMQESCIESVSTQRQVRGKRRVKPESKLTKRKSLVSNTTDESDSDEEFTAVKQGKRRKKKECGTCGSQAKCECFKQHKCPTCDKVFNHASNLRQHKASHTDARPFVCDVCGLGFKTRTNWKTHKSRHAKAFKCDICGRAFSLAPALKYHIRTHTGERPFQCDTCGMTFTSTGGLHAHAKRHQVKERTFKCNLCDKAFISKTNLETHIRIHQGVRPFPCPYCDLRFASRPHLNKHKRQHTKEKAYKCEFCSKGFFTTKLLDIHRGKHTGNKRYSCDICGNKFTTSSTLKDHMLLHSSVKPFQCHVCQKEFAANKTLKKHMQIHNTENPLVCEFCGKKCPAPKYLKSHMKMHLGYERHQCNVCGKSYRDPRYLQIHIKSHTGEGLIQCEACGEHFADPMYLKLHQKKHCKARKEHCHICGQGFANKNDLALHMGLHSGERPFGCMICGKAYTSAEALADHSKRHDFKMKTHQCSVCFKRFYTANDLQRHCRRTQCAKGSRFEVARKLDMRPLQVNMDAAGSLEMDREVERSVAPVIPLTTEESATHPLTSSSSGLLTIDSSVINSTSVASNIQIPSSGPSLDNSLSLAMNTVADGASYIMYDMMPHGKQADK